MNLFGILLCQLTVVAESGAQSIGTNLPSAPVTAACIEQDKPPCLIETKYLCDPDGSNPIKIELAYPITERRINSRIRNRGQLISVEKLKPTAPAPRLSHSVQAVIAITEPREMITSHRIIELKGVCNRPLKRIRYDVINSIEQHRDQEGFVTDSYFDTARWEVTTNYFQCFDINLARGTNLIVLHCEDYEGHQITTNLVYVLRFNHAPPSVSIQWPVPGQELSGNSFLVRGQVDNIAARIFGQISARDMVKTVEGIVERNGRFWVENIPLLARTNRLMLKVNDGAGNTTTKNLLIVRSDNVLTIDPVPARQLWQFQVTVTGKVSPPDQEVWLNGRQAVVKSDGTWVATGVPLTKGGVAIFEAIAVPKSITPTAALTNVNSTTAAVVPHALVAVQTALAPSQITLNSSMPAYGTFRLHLTGTGGRSFVISASPNLVDWTPILTNRDAGPTFDYSDTNVLRYGCRFFRVTPIEQ